MLYVNGERRDVTTRDQLEYAIDEESTQLRTPNLKAAMLKAKLDNAQEAYVLAIGDSVIYGAGVDTSQNAYVNMLGYGIAQYITGETGAANWLITASEAYDGEKDYVMSFNSRANWAKQESAYSFPDNESHTASVLRTESQGEYWLSSNGLFECRVCTDKDISR